MREFAAFAGRIPGTTDAAAPWFDVERDAALDRDAAMRRLLRKVCDATRADAASIAVVDRSGYRLVSGIGLSVAPIGGRDALGSLVVESVDGRRTVVSCDLPAEPGGEALPARVSGFRCGAVAPMIAGPVVVGVLEVYYRTSMPYWGSWIRAFEAAAAEAAIILDHARLCAEQSRMDDTLSDVYDRTLEAWIRVLDLRDSGTHGHSRAVTRHAERLGKTLGLAEQDLTDLRRGALLHDIGKVGVPDAILRKPGRLSDQEWAIMRRHPEFAREMLSPCSFLGAAVEVPYAHHERWDGGGYPRGLRGRDIPLLARIFAACDIWDAIRRDRPYRAAWSYDRARAHIAALRGTHLDPEVVDAFLSLAPSLDQEGAR